MSATADFSSPSLSSNKGLAESPFELGNQNYLGEWHLVRTSNNFWKDKCNVRMRYTDSGDDQFSFSIPSSSVEKTMKGRNKLVPGTVATFAWQGTGLLRLFGLQWEILGLECKEDDQRSWMVTFQHKTIFTSPAINLAFKSKDNLSKEIIRTVENWIVSLGDESLTKAVKTMFMIEQV